MSDAINRRQDGRDDFVAAWFAGWHGKGTVEQRDLTVADALDILDPGEIQKMPFYVNVTGPDGFPMEVEYPGRVATVRIRNNGAEVTPLGLVSPDYPVFDERVSFGFLENLVNANYATVSAMCMMDGGRRAAACLELPSIMVGGFDEVKRYVACYTSHDGTLKYRAGETDIRVVCKNTATMFIQGTERMYELKHTPGAELDVAKAREVMGKTEAYGAAFASMANEMIARKVTDAQFEKMVRELYGKQADRPGASKKAVGQFNKVLELSMDLWKGRTVGEAGVGNTAWGAWNVFTEKADWFTTLRNADGSETKINQDGAAAMETRFERNLTGENEAEKAKAQSVVMALSS
jgi:phage/plasmid-like protein (TIGR03299 family)